MKWLCFSIVLQALLPYQSLIYADELKKTHEVVSSCISSEAAVEDIKKNREENEKKRKELATWEAELKAKEAVIAEQLKKLEEVRSSISQIQEGQKREVAEKISKLMETLVTMSPKAAAKVISSLDEKLAVAVMLQTDNQRLAKIMNLMDAKSSTRLSELMTGMDHAKGEAKGVNNHE